MAPQAQVCGMCKKRLPQAASFCPTCGAATSKGSSESKPEYELEKFFALALDMFCIAGVDGHFKRVNPAFERTLGYSTEEIMAKPFVDFIHPEDRTETLREVDRLATGVPTLSFRNRYRCQDGSYKHLHWTSFPDPETGLLFAVARDETEYQQMESELYRLKAELRKTLERSAGTEEE